VLYNPGVQKIKGEATSKHKEMTQTKSMSALVTQETTTVRTPGSAASFMEGINIRNEMGLK